MKKIASILLLFLLLLAGKTLVAQDIELRCWPMNDTLLSGTSNTITLHAKDRQEMKVVFGKGITTTRGTVSSTYYVKVSKSLVGKKVTVKVRQGKKVVYQKTYPVIAYAPEAEK